MTSNIVIEYKNLLIKEEKLNYEITVLPVGYISKKVIQGKEYYYLQSRNGKKVSSRYIRNDEKDLVAKKIELRKKYELELPKVKERLSEIEKAAKIFDVALFRELQLIKISTGMDELSESLKQECIAFSDTMTSIEGIESTEQAKDDLNQWKKGHITFLKAYEKTLKRYGFKQETGL